MKKIFSIFILIFMLASVFCIGALAKESDPLDKEPAAGVVLRVVALKEDLKTNVLIGDYTDFEEGWNTALELAMVDNLEENGYVRVTVNFYSDWKATDGNFTDDTWNGAGFESDTIRIPSTARVTVNLNGHTIDRGLTSSMRDGEVIWIEDEADVIITNGTIKGGWSNNGAGGIHVMEDVNLVLQDVHVKGNRVSRDDGGGIAIYSDSTLTMIGGSIADNYAISDSFTTCYGAGIFAYGATVKLTGVTIENNQSEGEYECRGAAIYSHASEVTLTSCKVLNNGIEDESRNFTGAWEVITQVKDAAVFIADNTTFSGNGAHEDIDEGFAIYVGESGGPESNPDKLIEIAQGKAHITGCTFNENRSRILLFVNFSALYVSDSVFTNNNSSVYTGIPDEGSNFKRCTFKGNYSADGQTFLFLRDGFAPVFTDCEMNDSTYQNKSYAKFETTSVTAGSMFNSGSVSIVCAVISVGALACSFCLSIVKNRKKAAAEAKSESSEDE